MNLGQFFTPLELVNFCLSLSKNKKSVLEPSCGDGAFYLALKNNFEKTVFIEKDEKIIKQKDVLCMDFFDYDIKNKFETIIGNPPYVNNQMILEDTKSKIKGKSSLSSNLYIHFIEKCLYHLKDKGELIFIVPREFIKLTSSKYINDYMFNKGTITHYYDFGDNRFFNNVSQNICIFRFEKGETSKETITNKGVMKTFLKEGIISFFKEEVSNVLGDFFDIKVGAVSGLDKIFESENGVPFVFSKTRKTNKLKKMLYDNKEDEKIIKNKKILLNRKIKKFDERNWWKWGREINFLEGKKRIYVNCKTRNKDPFFINDCPRWDGAMLALFPKYHNINVEKAIKALNNLDWEELGFKTGGRYCFSQKSLMEVPVDRRMFESITPQLKTAGLVRNF